VLGSNQRRLSRRFYRPLSFNPRQTPLTSGYVFSDAVQVHRRPLPVRAPPVPHSHGQENAWPRMAGMGAVTLTAHPVPSPRRPRAGGRICAARHHDPAGSRHHGSYGQEGRLQDSATCTAHSGTCGPRLLHR
jgi:hypothetical protein